MPPIEVKKYQPPASGQELRKHQTMFDFVTQHAGSIEGVFEAAIMNGISITESVAPGEQLDVSSIDEKVAGAFAQKGLVISTGQPLADGIKLPGGIGYMKIEATFIVS